MAALSIYRIWANRLEDRKNPRSWSEVLGSRVEGVKAVLKEDVASGKNEMTAERYEEITGEAYEPA